MQVGRKLGSIKLKSYIPLNYQFQHIYPNKSHDAKYHTARDIKKSYDSDVSSERLNKTKTRSSIARKSVDFR
jgi:hypothetical protein